MSRPGRRTSSNPARSRTRAAVALAAALAAVTLVGCGGGDDGPASAGMAGAPAAQDGSAADEDQALAESGSTGPTVDRAGRLSQASLAAERRQIMTAGLVVETDGVLFAARQAESIAVGAGGFVTDEDTLVEQRGGDGSTDEVAAVTVSSLAVRVPPTTLDDVLGRLAALGTLVSQNRATTDVTDEYVDVEARLASQRASLDRLLQLVGTAGDLDDVIALENEIARRQSDLDGLAARLQSLEEQAELATIALTLTSQQDAVVLRAEEGFLAGLSSGWNAFTGSVVAALTVVGAVLPFAVLAAVVAIPVLLVRRRRLTSVVGPDAPSAAPPAAQA